MPVEKIRKESRMRSEARSKSEIVDESSKWRNEEKNRSVFISVRIPPSPGSQAQRTPWTCPQSMQSQRAQPAESGLHSPGSALHNQ